jgi:hypothetical protein
MVVASYRTTSVIICPRKTKIVPTANSPVNSSRAVGHAIRKIATVRSKAKHIPPYACFFAAGRNFREHPFHELR